MRKGFLLYNSLIDLVDELTDEEAGKLFKGILRYANGGDPSLDGVAKIAFLSVKPLLDESMANYDRKCEANRINGQKGGRPKKTQENPSVISETHGNPSVFLETHGNPQEPKDKNKNKNKDNISKEISVLEMAVDEFIKMRKSIKKPISELGLKRLMNRLDTLAKTDEDKAKILLQSVDHCWQDVYPISDRKPSRGKNVYRDERDNTDYINELESGLKDGMIL